MNEVVPHSTVSVVIPCFNQGHYLADAIRSAFARGADVDVVVVDDGSSDDTAAVAARSRTAGLVRQPHRGAAAARNRGQLASSGEFVVFLDATDRLLPGGIDAGVRALQAHPDCAMAYGRCAIVGADGELWPPPEVPAIRSGHHAALLQTNPIAAPGAAIFRRAALEHAGGFLEGFDGAADYDLYLRISREAPIHDHGRVVSAYRRYGRSARQDTSRMMRDTLAVMRRNRPQRGSTFYDAWRHGYFGWRDFYGGQLAEEMRQHLQRRETNPMVRKAMALAALAPAVLLREAAWAAARARAMPAARRRAAG